MSGPQPGAQGAILKDQQVIKGLIAVYATYWKELQFTHKFHRTSSDLSNEYIKKIQKEYNRSCETFKAVAELKFTMLLKNKEEARNLAGQFQKNFKDEFDAELIRNASIYSKAMIYIKKELQIQNPAYFILRYKGSLSAAVGS